MVNQRDKRKHPKGQSLRERFLRGSFWSGIGGGMEQLTRFVRNMLLTRLLVPEAFSEIAIILALNVFFESLTEVGIRESIIQNKMGGDDEFLSVSFWFSFVRSIVLYAVVFSTAPLIAQFYDNAALIPKMRIAFLAIVFNGLISTKAYASLRNVKPRKWVIVHNGGKMVGVVVTVILGVIRRDAYALVYGFTVEYLVRMLLSYLIFPFRPKFTLNKTYLTEVLRFARGMLGLPFLTMIFLKADVLVAGRMFTPYIVGLYSMATVLAQAPNKIVPMILSPVLMPALAELKSDPVARNRGIIGISRLLAFIGMPTSLFAILYYEPIITLVYTAEYAVMGVCFAIIFCAYMLRNLCLPLAATFLSIGKPQIQRLFALMRAVIAAATIVPLIKLFGIIGAPIALLIAMALSQIFQVFLLGRHVYLDHKQYIRAMALAAFVSAPLALAKVADLIFFHASGYWQLLPGFIGLGCCLLLAARMLKRSGSTDEKMKGSA